MIDLCFTAQIDHYQHLGWNDSTAGVTPRVFTLASWPGDGAVCEVCPPANSHRQEAGPPPADKLGSAKSS